LNFILQTAFQLQVSLFIVFLGHQIHRLFFTSIF